MSGRDSDVVDYRDFLRTSEVSVVDLQPQKDRPESRSFVPADAVKRHLSKPVLRNLLAYYNIPATSLIHIQQSYIFVFTILIVIGKGGELSRFLQWDSLADHRLPFRRNDRSAWPPECRNFFSEFYKAQWKFCAHTFRHGMNDTRLDDEVILPYLSREVLKMGPDSCTYKVEIHPSYNELIPTKDGHPTAINTFIIKTCRAKDSQLHHNEVEAYKIMDFSESILPNTVRIHGSWVQRQEYSMCMEHVGGATLEDFFARPPPVYEEDIILFWERLVDVLKPLARIQKHPNPDNIFKFLQGIHNDIKPTNILVAEPNNAFQKESNRCSSYDVTFKLADLGLTHFSPAEKERKARIKAVSGTQIFTAPEYYRNEKDRFSQSDIREAKPSKDIWSMGCVFSEAVVWSVLGPEGLNRYRTERTKATNEISKLCNSAYSGCFHDTKKVLHIVHEMHTQASIGCRRGDNVVAGIINVVESMLQDSQRPSAAEAYEYCEDILTVAKSMSRPSQRSPQTVLWPASPPTPGESRSDPYQNRFNPPGDQNRFDPRGSPQPPFGLGLHEENQNYEYQRPFPPPSSNPPPIFRHSWDESQQRPSPVSPQIALPRVSESPERLCDDTSIRARRYRNRPSPSNTVPAPNRHSSHARHLSAESNDEERLAPNNPYRSKIKERQSSPNRISNPPELRVEPPAASPAPHFKLEYVSIGAVNNWIKDTKKRKVLPLRGIEHLRKLDNRDQIFIFDDSASMDTHWNNVLDTFGALAYLVKSKDPDGIEIRYTSNPTYYDRNKDRKPLFQKLSRSTRGGNCDIGLTLGRVLKELGPDGSKNLLSRLGLHKSNYKPKKWGVNIYIFTDGIWQDGDGWVDRIVQAMKRLEDQGMEKGQLGIQFIQFGDNAEGTRRLKILDDELRQYGVMQDFVDTEHWTGNAYKMLLGAIDPGWDQARTPQSSSEANTDSSHRVSFMSNRSHPFRMSTS
ncbi:unnamed protein product [Periconia digitata]|uniref:Protein kinase domain-containing protein n=1 Tax=Periconia digitata TaxID=1303443 RepID=A0A9W4UTP4_9PLEO|nr:unnamed protein product [Periconia digitata]